MATYQNQEELFVSSRNAKADLDKANTKEEIIAVFKKHVTTVGYKSLGKLLIGQSPEEAVKKWANKLDEKNVEKSEETIHA